MVLGYWNELSDYTKKDLNKFPIDFSSNLFEIISAIQGSLIVNYSWKKFRYLDDRFRIICR